jgi:N-acetylneuraminic acid mutarotase
MPPGYSVTWTNSATGSSGSASFYLGCLLQVNVIWETYPIALAMGANTITVTATDADGNSASSSLVVNRVEDVTAPLVVSVSPPAGASDVAVNATVLVTFNEQMDPASIDASTITLHDELGNPVPTSVAYLAYSKSARLTPASPLAYSITYDVMVTQGVRDVTGNSLAEPYAFSFTTRANPDTTPPSVQSVNPPDGSYCASPSGAVSATFDEDIDPLTIDATTFTLTGPGGQAVGGTVSYLDRTATFIPDAALPLSTPFTATLMTGIKDLEGNPLAASYPWSFTTAGTQTGSWTPTSLNGAPSARSNHVAVWTGSEMIVSGGFGSDYTSQFGRYDPSTGTWTVSTGAPVGIYQKAVWADSRMLVWGGYIYGYAVTGGAAYDPGTNSWTPLSTAGEPSARYDHTAVWTGNEMIVWGGRNSLGSTFDNGFRYDPLSDTWKPVSTNGAPSARYGHTAVWTGSEMIVWGGSAPTGFLNDGARYDPASDSWTPISSVGAPSERMGHVAVWTGSEMIVWGNMFGSTNTGGRYNPATDSWRPTDSLCAPSGRWRTSAVWTGTRMVIWGGAVVNSYLADGYEYDPVADAWQQVTALGTPSARADHSTVWTGSKMIIWGGLDGGRLNSGGLLTP